MSIRIIARDLYRLQKEVEILERQIESSSPEKKEELKDLLRKVRAEKNRMRRILDGAKEPPA
jgi:cell division protein FtsL